MGYIANLDKGASKEADGLSQRQFHVFLIWGYLCVFLQDFVLEKFAP